MRSNNVAEIRPSPTYAYCMLCSCGVTESNWTERFKAFLLSSNDVFLSDEFICPFGRLASNYSIQLPDGGNIEIRARTRTNLATPTDLYLLHTSCLHLLRSLAGNDISLTSLFCLCQSLQQDLCRHFDDDFEDEGVRATPFLDPSKPMDIATNNTEGELERIKDQCRVCHRLPTEIQIMIMEHLDTESLMHYFAASDEHILAAVYFAWSHPGLFYPISGFSAISTLISNISHDFSKANYKSLSRRWEAVEDIMASAKDVQLIRKDLSISRGPKIGSTIGCHRKSVKLAGLESLKIYYRRFRKNDYVCGVRFNYPDMTVTAGEDSKNHKTQSASGIKEISFLIDSLGFRNLQLGSKPFHTAPHQSRCWEGLLKINMSEELEITTDGFKVRTILPKPHQTPSSFIECLIFWPRRPPSNLLISESNYVTQDPITESMLVERFGGFTVEALAIPKDLKSVSLFCNEIGLILGIGINSVSEFQHIGCVQNVIEHQLVMGLDEVIEEIAVQTAYGGGADLVATIRTNLDRESTGPSKRFPFLDYTCKVLKSPADHYICGIYARFERFNDIKSFGLICAPRARLNLD